ncbi:hypothetical protein [uncultured Kriegella sp.]|uniref:hypothetical protein n=1 Tax=uncultured Kriegella sp. TaxID=1798910 RepID=UPI0030DD2112
MKVYLPEESIANNRKTKYTFEILKDEAVKKKNKLLLGLGKTDASGNYEIKLSDQYKGGPVAFDIEVTEVPNQKVKITKKIQFTVTTLQPVWKEVDGESHYSWHYCLPYHFWGGIRTAFDAWLICGHVKSSSDNRTPIAGAKVSAYDSDWIKDDLLGTVSTDSSGYFRIDYSSIDFKQTFLSPLVNVETPFSAIPGPGVYFKVVSHEGIMLYEEGKSDGKKMSRLNIPNCFGIELYVDCNA